MPHRSSVVSVLAGLLLFLLIGSAAGAATLTVTSTADSDAGSLRDAITTAAAGDTIIFAAGITTINLTTGQLSIDKNLTINGGSGVTVTRQAGSPNFRIFNIASGNTVILDGLIISNGNVVAAGSGGGIANAGTLTLRNSTVSGNTANGIGGGISNTGTFNLDRTRITSNHADFSGGGIGQIDGGTLDLRNSLIDGNSSNRDGGGLTSQSVSVNASATIMNCTFTGNTAVSNFSEPVHDLLRME